MKPVAPRSAWLTLLRPANLFTVPGDPLAGWLLATNGGTAPTTDPRGLWTLPAALLIYASGLILNDVADLAIDRRERPWRPLPAGHLVPGAAATAGLLVGCGGVACAARAGDAALAVAALLLALVLLYDFLLPRGSRAGVMTLGLCRASSVALGAVAGGWTVWSLPSAPPGLAAAGIGGTIAAVSLLAAREMEPGRVGGRRWLPLGVWGVALSSLTFAAPTQSGRALLLLGVHGLLSLAALARATQRFGAALAPAAKGAAIGGFIRCLLPLQALCCALAGGWGLWAALALLALWPLAARSARRYAAS